MKVAQSKQYGAKMFSKTLPVTLFSRGNHGFLRNKNSKAFFKVTEQFRLRPYGAGPNPQQRDEALVDDVRGWRWTGPELKVAPRQLAVVRVAMIGGV